METIFIRCIVYLFLNSEERPSLHITSKSIPFVGGIWWSYKWNKKAAIVSLFFCFESEQIKNVLQVPSQMVAAAVVAPQCRLYFILVLTRVVHCKINLSDWLGFTMFAIPLTLLLLHTVYREIFKNHGGWPKFACL